MSLDWMQESFTPPDSYQLTPSAVQPRKLSDDVAIYAYVSELIVRR